MIRFVRGTVAALGKDYIVVDLSAGAANSGAVGVLVSVPETTLAQLRVQDLVTLHTHLQVREDVLALFGFETEEELIFFNLLLGVSGVGPKVALATLSTLSPDALRLALANDEPAVIARVPGIGKRTAQKIVIELKDKVSPPDSALTALADAMDNDAEVIDALVGLGWSVVEAQRAVQQLPADAVGIEERLRLALSQFSQQ